MQYRKNRCGEKISALGYGCMRFPQKNGSIDMEKTKAQIAFAIKHGVNYFDTAYIYPGSEEAVGKIMEELGVRKDINIATKLPQYLVHSNAAIDKYFKEQLSRLRTDYIDYYLMHMMTDVAQWDNLEKCGIRQWIDDRKAEGSIRNIGFSFHGSTDMFLKILNAYDWDFCQIQYNYLDEYTQAGRRGLEAARDKGIPVIIMEPLRGGRLVDLLPAKAKKLIAENSRGWTPAGWAFRWLWDQKGVTCVLSGMNSKKMIAENIKTACETRPGSLTEEDKAFLAKVCQAIRENVKVGCTGCRYCMPCPQGVDIPSLFSSYNSMYTERKAGGRHEYMQTVAFRKEPAFATQCVRCGKCERACPQGLRIMDLIQEADRAVRPLPYRIGYAVARKILYR
ncbi:MAG: aldo/keto reductase [Lachnospiraceae bacterium]|nr:aldo/keto reductase [Lachnospiraceae bacterium]